MWVALGIRPKEFAQRFKALDTTLCEHARQHIHVCHHMCVNQGIGEQANTSKSPNHAPYLLDVPLRGKPVVYRRLSNTKLSLL